MKNKLVYKLITGFLIAALTGFFLVSFLISHFTYKELLEKDAKQMYSESTTIATSYGRAYYANTISSSEFYRELNAFSSFNNCSIMLIDSSGDVLLDTGNSGRKMITDFDPTENNHGYYRTDDFYGVFDEEYLTTYYPVEYLYTVQGYIVISRPLSEIKSDSNDFFNYNYVTFLVTLGLCAVASIYFIANISMPLKKLTAITDSFATGDFSKHANLNRNDEIGRLGASIDYMASEINNLNEYKTSFIANISHDFRSPLTSIKGYLEAILDGTIPPQMQEKYLKIVIAETERLTKLTNNLITLNTISDRNIALDISDFDIVASIKQTIETFEGTCEKKHIKFKLVFPDKSVMVHADQGKIQQVIYNLIDNAIKFSNPESSIIISVTTKGDKVLTSVKDFGIGIPKDSQAKIWERFYKSDLSRGKDKKGTGLGLSIVKDIITAHKEYIDVISTEGVGTEFIFALPKSKEAKISLIKSLSEE